MSAARGNLYPRSRLHIKTKSFSTTGVKVWNCLPPSIRTLSKSRFTKKCKSILVNDTLFCDDYVDLVQIMQIVYKLK